MDTPWFLAHLGLARDADQAAIKRAYAERLRKIDQATDIEGFMRLRQAYQLAMAHDRPPEPVQAPTPVPSTPDQAVATEQPAPASTAAAESESLVSGAMHALEELRAGLARQQDAAQTLRDQLSVLRQGHLQAVAVFEQLLIDHLARARLPQALALFHAGQEQLPWADVTHLMQLGVRGAWLHDASQQEMAWRRASERSGCHDLMDRLGGIPALHQAGLQATDFSRDCALRWPDMQQLLRAYPRYLALRVQPSSIEAWQQAFAALPQRDQHMAEAFSNLPTPAAHAKTLPPRQRAPIGFPIGIAIVAMVFLGNLSQSLMHDWSSPRAGVSTTSAPADARPAMVLPDHPAISAANCRRVEQAVHATDWQPPQDPTQRHRLSDTATQCLRAHLWPHWRMADPQLARLGIAT